MNPTFDLTRLKNAGIAALGLKFRQQKPGVAPGFYTVRDNRAVPAVSVALPIHHPNTVTYEQFCTEL